MYSKLQDSKNDIAFHSAEEIPDGDYLIAGESRDRSSRKLTIKVSNIELIAQVSELDIDGEPSIIKLPTAVAISYKVGDRISIK